MLSLSYETMPAAGIVRTIVYTGTAQRNITALPYGDYLIRVDGAPCFILQGGSMIVATATTGMRLRDGDTFQFSASDHSDATAARAFLSIIAEGAGTGTAYVQRVDPQGALTQPPAWA